MAGHWHFLELSVPTPDVAASLDFYRCLGFSELVTGDIRSYSYAVVSDGRIAIGLHGAGLSAPALSFSQEGAAQWARQLEAAGFELEFQHLGVDDFHEFALASPAGQLAVVMEAPTFSRLQVQEASTPLTGPSAHIEFGCDDLEAAIDFWKLAGLEEESPEPAIDPTDPESTIQVEGAELAEEPVVTEDEEPVERAVAELAAPSVRLHLSIRGGNMPRIHFQTPSADLPAALERAGLEFKPWAGRKILTAPEGTVLVLP